MMLETYTIRGKKYAARSYAQAEASARVLEARAAREDKSRLEQDAHLARTQFHSK